MEDDDGKRFPLVAVWLASLVILAAVVFREITVFLLRIEGSSNAYGPSVFTGWQLKASETDDLLAAAGPAGVWTTNPLADPFVGWHLSLDFLFIFVLGAILFRCLVAVGEPRRRGPVRVPSSWLVVLLPLLYTVADLAETGYTFHAFGCAGLGGTECAFLITPEQAQTIHRLSDVKWLLLLLNVVVIAGLYFWNGAEGRVSWQRRRSLRAGLRGRDLRVAGPPVGAFVVVGLFVVLIALPGGSALDQMPDVIRAQVDQGQAGDLRHVAASGVRARPLPRQPVRRRVHLAPRPDAATASGPQRGAPTRLVPAADRGRRAARHGHRGGRGGGRPVRRHRGHPLRDRGPGRPARRVRTAVRRRRRPGAGRGHPRLPLLRAGAPRRRCRHDPGAGDGERAGRPAPCRTTGPAPGRTADRPRRPRRRDRRGAGDPPAVHGQGRVRGRGTGRARRGGGVLCGPAGGHRLVAGPGVPCLGVAGLTDPAPPRHPRRRGVRRHRRPRGQAGRAPRLRRGAGRPGHRADLAERVAVGGGRVHGAQPPGGVGPDAPARPRAGVPPGSDSSWSPGSSPASPTRPVATTTPGRSRSRRTSATRRR